MFERFFNNTNELLCIFDSEVKFLDLNDAFITLLGFPKNTILSKPLTYYVHANDIKKTQDKLSQLSDGLEVVNLENHYITNNNSTYILSWNLYPDIINGEIYGVVKNVTSERKAMFNFKQLEQAIIDNVIYAKTDAQGRIIEVNDKFCLISGYRRDELIGKTHKVVNSGEHDKSFFANMWRTITAGNVWTGPITNRRKDGSLYFVESIITPILNTDGNIDAFIAIRFDITDRMEVKKESEKNLQILNETSAIAKVGGWELDVNTGVLSWTDETFKILGVQKKQSQNPVLPEGLQLFIDEHKPIIDNAVNQCIEYGQPYELELQALTPNGERKWIFTNGKANYVEGELVTLSGTIQDIHEKKLNEIKYNQERQKTLQNSKLTALGELSASIAHEINNPLGIISGYAELLKCQKSLDESSVTMIDTILKSSDRISYIVKNLKRFSRTDTEHVKTKINLINLTQETLSLVRPKIKRNMINFEMILANSAYINGNEIEIEQVIINLLNNAIDAIYQQDDSWIKLTIENTDTNVVITLEDSGNGIPDSVQVKMFEPFFTTKDINKGTGLGLSVVKGIIDDHNGTIEIDNSKPNTCFQLTFPTYKPEV